MELSVTIAVMGCVGNSLWANAAMLRSAAMMHAFPAPGSCGLCSEISVSRAVLEKHQCGHLFANGGVLAHVLLFCKEQHQCGRRGAALQQSAAAADCC